MAVTAAMVKELRELTGAGMLDCKKCLEETGGDIDKAVELLREKGLAKAAKKSGRIAAEGLVVVKQSEDWKKAVIVEVNSETDFVSKNETFQEFADDIASHILQSSAKDVESVLAETYYKDKGQTLEDFINSKIAIIGENLKLRRFERVESEGAIVAYIHMGGKIGVLVNAVADGANPELVKSIRNVAMQVAALNPKYVSSKEVDSAYLEHEKEILKAQAKNENPDKPDNIIEKMIMGRLNKQLKEICLLDQPYVKDGDLTVKKYIEGEAKRLDSPIEIKSFIRYETGEGIEKKEEDFAAEVAKQMGQ